MTRLLSGEGGEGFLVDWKAELPVFAKKNAGRTAIDKRSRRPA